MKVGKLTLSGGKLVEESREINQSELSEECWEIQFRGLEACENCRYKGKRSCGGKDIIKTGKNNKGFSVPLTSEEN